MRIEMLVGLEVINNDVYQTYRKKIAPLLSEYGGGFGYDLKVSEVLKSETGHPINRVFTIYFEDKHSKDAFFNHPDYLNIKQAFYEKSVKTTTVISSYEKA